MTIPSSVHLTTLQPYGRKKPSEGAVFGPWGKSPGHQDAQHMAEGRRETRGWARPLRAAGLLFAFSEGGPRYQPQPPVLLEGVGRVQRW